MDLAAHYVTLKTLHVTAVACSGSLFLLRATAGLLGAHGVMHPVLRYASYAIDVVLLASAVSLAVVLGQAPLINAWLTVKVGLLAVYVVLGSVALKRGRTRRHKAIALFFAVVVFFGIVTVAMTHHRFS